LLLLCQIFCNKWVTLQQKGNITKVTKLSNTVGQAQRLAYYWYRIAVQRCGTGSTPRHITGIKK